MMVMNPGRAGCSFCGRDLWEVPRFVWAGAAVICADCVEVASKLLAADGDAERELRFPPRVFGEPPDENAVDAIVESFRIVFGGAAGRPELYEGHLQDVAEMRPLLLEAGNRHPTQGGRSRVDRLRFSHPDVADVRFQIVLQGGAALPFEGQDVRRDGQWLVSRATAAAVAASGGVGRPRPPQWGVTGGLRPS